MTAVCPGAWEHVCDPVSGKAGEDGRLLLLFFGEIELVVLDLEKETEGLETLLVSMVLCGVREGEEGRVGEREGKRE